MVINPERLLCVCAHALLAADMHGFVADHVDFAARIAQLHPVIAIQPGLAAQRMVQPLQFGIVHHKPGVQGDVYKRQELSEADVVLFLASTAALATDYITRHEIPKALELHTTSKTVVVPVILEACRWEQSPWVN